jgi:hypothetical protein
MLQAGSVQLLLLLVTWLACVLSCALNSINAVLTALSTGAES